MVHSDMLCFVQAFTSSKKKDKNAITEDHFDDTYTLTNNEESSTKPAKKNFTRRLSFSLRKKSPSCPSSGTATPLGDKSESSPIHFLKNYGYEEMSQNQEVSIQQHAAAAAAAEEILTNTPGSSKARQKKFHRHFNEVPQEEKVINYYSCALISDVLLHGNLYITKNYFAFYSNLFGNINKILIPTASILKITKEKTVLSKPNAVAVITVKEKHLFGLFLSRDTTYKLMIQVWNSAMKPLPSQFLSPPLKESVKDIAQSSSSRDPHSCNDDESSLSGSEIVINSPDLLQTSYSNKYSKSADNTDSTINSAIVAGSSTMSSRVDEYCQTIVPTWTQYIHSGSKANFVLGTSTILLAILFLSAGVLLYRISCLQHNYSQNSYLTTTRSMNEIQEFLSLNLHYISKVRKSLEALSVLIEQEVLSNIADPAANTVQG